MSQENVEVVRRAFGLVTAGDLQGIGELIGPGFELRENVLAPDAAVYYGPDGLKKWFEASFEAFAAFRFEIERLLDRGDWVFASVRAHGRGRESGAPFTARYVTAFEFRLGKVVMVASHSELSEALAAAGLEE